MLANVKSCAVIGLEGVVVDVEVDTRQGLPGVVIVGLPDAAVQESRKRIFVNIAPASIRKADQVYDLPIADLAEALQYRAKQEF